MILCEMNKESSIELEGRVDTRVQCSLKTGNAISLFLLLNSLTYRREENKMRISGCHPHTRRVGITGMFTAKGAVRVRRRTQNIPLHRANYS
jgi:hypothetical protein